MFGFCDCVARGAPGPIPGLRAAGPNGPPVCTWCDRPIDLAAAAAYRRAGQLGEPEPTAWQRVADVVVAAIAAAIIALGWYVSVHGGQTP